MTKRLTKPQEVCPVCSREFVYYTSTHYWGCLVRESAHVICGPDDDYYGRGIDRMVRNLEKRIIRKHEAKQRKFVEQHYGK